MATEKPEQPEKPGRKNQPRCVDCSHPRSFHGGGTTKCRALGCRCATWVPPQEESTPVEPVSAL